MDDGTSQNMQGKTQPIISKVIQNQKTKQKIASVPKYCDIDAGEYVLISRFEIKPLENSNNENKK